MVDRWLLPLPDLHLHLLRPGDVRHYGHPRAWHLALRLKMPPFALPKGAR